MDKEFADEESPKTGSLEPMSSQTMQPISVIPALLQQGRECLGWKKTKEIKVEKGQEGNNWRRKWGERKHKRGETERRMRGGCFILECEIKTIVVCTSQVLGLQVRSTNRS